MLWDITVIFLFVVLILLALFIIVLSCVCLSNLHLTLKYRDNLEFFIRLWFIKINITKLLSKTKKQKKPRIIHFDEGPFGELSLQEKKQVKKKSKNFSANKPSKAVAQKMSVAEILTLIRDLLESTSEPLKKVAYLKIYRLYVTACSEDAAKTAVLFGQLNGVMGTLILVCEKYKNLYIEKDHTGVYSDFSVGKPSLELHLQLDFSIRHIILSSISALTAYMKSK